MSGNPLLSRVAESIYWMDRYIERAENLARFIDVTFGLMLDLPGAGEAGQWDAILRATAQREAFLERYDTIDQRNVIEFLTLDEDNPSSIIRCVQAARENARSVREVISSEMWEQINAFYLTVRAEGQRRLHRVDPPAFFKRIKTEAHLFSGVTDATLPHGEAWQFGRLARLLERADMTSRILDVKYFILLPSLDDVGTPFDNLQWAALLKSASGLEAYRKRYGRISPQPVAEFLLLDRDFPRSVLFCIDGAEDALRAITGTQPGSFHNRAGQLLGRMEAHLGYARIDEVIGAGLHEFLDDLQIRFNQVGDAIFDAFFALRPMASATTGAGPQ